MLWCAGGLEPQDTVPSFQALRREDSMSLSRRHFFRNLGLGSAGLLSTPFIIGRGHEAMAFEAGALQPPDDGGFIRISSNENARGPGKKTMDALRNTISPARRTRISAGLHGRPRRNDCRHLRGRPRPRHRRHRIGSHPRRRDAGVLLGPEARWSPRRRPMEPRTRRRAALAPRSR